MSYGNNIAEAVSAIRRMMKCI